MAYGDIMDKVITTGGRMEESNGAFNSDAFNEIKDVISALKSETVSWDRLMAFTERSFYELNDEFDRIRQSSIELQQSGNDDAAQRQFDLATFFMSARDNSILMNAIARLGIEIGELQDRLTKVEKQLNEKGSLKRE